MADPAKAVAYIELDDYLALEYASHEKHEYLDGVIYAIQGSTVRGMSGGSAAHAYLIRNAGFALHSQLRGGPCSVAISEMRLRIDPASAVFYPDVLVHCQPLSDPANTLELTDARLVIEVLSPGTERFDRTVKLAAHQQLPGLQHIVLIASTRAAAWHCQRNTDNTWPDLQDWPAGTDLPLPALAATLGWDAVFGGVFGNVGVA